MIPLGRSRDQLTTNLKNFVNSTSKKIYWSSKNRKIAKKSWNIGLEVRELIFTIHIIFQTCSEFDGEIFCKNRFLKKSFLKVLTNPNFVIFCSILVTKIEQKNTKFGLVRTFKNDFSKFCFTENFTIKLRTSLKNNMYGKNEFPGL